MLLGTRLHFFKKKLFDGSLLTMALQTDAHFSPSLIKAFFPHRFKLTKQSLSTLQSLYLVREPHKVPRRVIVASPRTERRVIQWIWVAQKT